MGIQYREYMHDDDSGRGFRGRSWFGRDMVLTLIVINAAVFVLQAVLTRQVTDAEINRRLDRYFERPEISRYLEEMSEEERAELRESQFRSLKRSLAGRRISIIEEWCSLDPPKVAFGQIWRLTTYDFLHDTSSIWHLVFNMWLLWIMGRQLEAYYGPREFLTFYLLAGIVSGICFLLWGAFLGDLAPAIGASGAVSAVVIAFAVRWPLTEFRLLGILPVPAYLLAALAVITDLHPMLMQMGGHNFRDGVAHSAHLGGMAFGALYVLQGWHLTSWLPKNALSDYFKRRGRRFKVYRPEADGVSGTLPRATISGTGPSKELVAERVDALLAKIAEEGADSLTVQEQEFLSQASRLYRRPQ